jgi:GT2 family glycosyltransferase
MGTPRVSVLMATYNGANYIARSIDSVLAQSFSDFELIVADDGSSDDTLQILESFTDPRLRVLRNPRNMGVVATRNRCFAEARGDYVALLDHDDLMRPRRLERQCAYLDAHTDTVLVATAAHELRDGMVTKTSHPPVTNPELMGWLLLLANQIIASSILFRAEAVRQLDAFMREECLYADDYDLYLRLLGQGKIARLDEALTIYRLHSGNASASHVETMTQNAIRALTPCYRALFGDDAAAAAALTVRHISARQPVRHAASWRQLVAVFDRINEAGLSALDATGQPHDILTRHAGVLWRRTLFSTASAGHIDISILLGCRPKLFQPALKDRFRIAAQALPVTSALRGLRKNSVVQPKLLHNAVDWHGIEFTPEPRDPDGMPRLYVIVDTEAEFDWEQPFSRELTDVDAMENIWRGQDIFDRYGLRPIYLVDYPVASQPRSYAPLRKIVDRGGCEIGAHLHPWTTPPFEEALGQYNSYVGNLDPALEARKLAELVGVIEKNLGIKPTFYRAGRYGLGPATVRTLVDFGITVDFSILPGADLRDKGGPNFSNFSPCPYRAGEGALLSLPMTRAVIGRAPCLASPLNRIGHWKWARYLHLHGIAARLGLANTVTLTPEGVSAGEQKQLIRHLLAAGERDFVLHYHSPSLAPGHTAYAKTAAESDALVARLEELCRFFCEEIAGLPGEPRALRRMSRLALRGRAPPHPTGARGPRAH